MIPFLVNRSIQYLYGYSRDSIPCQQVDPISIWAQSWFHSLSTGLSNIYMGTVVIPFLVNRSIQYLYGYSRDSIPCQQVYPISIWAQSWFHSLSTGQSNIYMGTVVIPFLSTGQSNIYMGTVMIPFLVNRSNQYLYGHSHDPIPCQQVYPISIWVQSWFHSLSTGQSNIYMGTVVIPFLSTDHSNIYTWAQLWFHSLSTGQSNIYMGTVVIPFLVNRSIQYLHGYSCDSIPCQQVNPISIWEQSWFHSCQQINPISTHGYRRDSIPWPQVNPISTWVQLCSIPVNRSIQYLYGYSRDSIPVNRSIQYLHGYSCDSIPVNRSIQYLYGYSHDSIPCQQVNLISIWAQSWFHSLSRGQSNIYMGTVLIPFLVNRSIQYLYGHRGTVMIPVLVNRSIQYLYGYSRDSIPCQQVNPISIWAQSWFHSLSTGQSNIYMGTVMIPFLVSRSIQYLYGYSHDSIPCQQVNLISIWAQSWFHSL